MQCNYCHKEVYVTHICPYCKEYFCMEHRSPQIHNCKIYRELKPTLIPPKEKTPTHIAKQLPIKKFQKSLFTSAFTLVLIEEILRLIGYLKYSPYLEPNFYIVLISQWITPYISSTMFFLLICIILFTTKKLSEKQHESEIKSLLSGAISISVYFTIIILYIYYMANWILIIAP
ncbi:AN1-type zinc finger domain-containing protein [Candidatus Bathyarchaeota archaeon]|nr:AN1-type zinc finger domain-containing protein [Candidatus Bathyarchaeota archaeon]